MSDDAELGDRLRRTLSSAAASARVGPPPPLSHLQREPRTGRSWLLAAAVTLAVAGVAAVVVGRVDDAEQVGTAGEGDGPSVSVPATVGADGRIVARGRDGSLTAVATATIDAAAGVVVVAVDVTDAPGTAAVSVDGAGLGAASADVAGCAADALVATVGFTVGVTTTTAEAMTVDVASGACGGGAERRVQLELELATVTPLAGGDGPASPSLTVVDDARDGVVADGIDGCLVEVLIDWGDRSPPAALDVPPLESCDGASALTLEAVGHDYAPGEYTQRVTVTTTAPDGTGGQVAFVEQRVSIA